MVTQGCHHEPCLQLGTHRHYSGGHYVLVDRRRRLAFPLFSCFILGISFWGVFWVFSFFGCFLWFTGFLVLLVAGLHLALIHGELCVSQCGGHPTAAGRLFLDCPLFSGPLADDWAAGGLGGFSFFRGPDVVCFWLFRCGYLFGGSGRRKLGPPPISRALTLPPPRRAPGTAMLRLRAPPATMVHTLTASASDLAAPARSSFG